MIRRTLSRFLISAGLIAAGKVGVAGNRETLHLPNAVAKITHFRVSEFVLTASGYVPGYRDVSNVLVPGRRWVAGASGDPEASDRTPDLRDVHVVGQEEIHNVKTTVGIDFIFSQAYNSSSVAQTNGLAWVGVSNDTLTETSASTTLSNEIAANGLTRAKGTYAHTAGTSTATNTITFTATGAQSCQKAAYFSAASSGTMMHVLSFTQRALVNTDTLQIILTVTLT